MTFEGLGEMIEGYSADMGAGKFPLASMGGRAEGQACADSGARTPIAAIITVFQLVFDSSIHRFTLYIRFVLFIMFLIYLK